MDEPMDLSGLTEEQLRQAIYDMDNVNPFGPYKGRAMMMSREYRNELSRRWADVESERSKNDN